MNAEQIDSFENDGSLARVSLFGEEPITAPGLLFEEQAFAAGFRFVAGVDEVGRGCLAGPVVAAACILDPQKPLPKFLNDSKKLSAERRDEIAAELRETAVCFAVGRIEADEIDRINILEATKAAMLKAIAALDPAAEYLLIDALQLKLSPLPQRAIIKGDSISCSIAAASVIAKTYRDALMAKYTAEFPEYGFEKHFGYGTKYHLDALRRHGPCPLHRKTFRGVIQPEADKL